MNLKDKITNWMALLVLIAQGCYVIIENWINGAPFEWKQLVGAVILAFILWATGKAANLKSKSNEQIKKQMDIQQ
jgi:hypothetical protein